MRTNQSTERAAHLLRLLFLVLAGVLALGSSSAYSYDGDPQESDGQFDIAVQSVPDQVIRTQARPENPVAARYDDRSQPARASARSGGYRLAPQTARAVHASELVESPLWTATKSRTSAQNAYRHFADHGADFPDIQNSLEYVAKAQNFLRTPPGGTLTRVRTNADVVRWHPGSNTFGVMDAGGAPRTFFRPDPSVHGYASNWDYFYAQ